jgi:hypothetical protein
MSACRTRAKIHPRNFDHLRVASLVQCAAGMRLHLVFDRLTGELKAQGKSGQLYSDKDIAVAEKRGDSSVLDDLDAGESFTLARAVSTPVALSPEALDAALDEALRAGVPWRRRHRGRR